MTENKSLTTANKSHADKPIRSVGGSSALAGANVESDSTGNMRRYLMAGLFMVVLIVFGIGGWAVTTSIAGAVVSQGTVVVESSVKKVQHPTGGVVGRINVKEGDRVRLGDVVISLDETTTRANLQIIVKQLDELLIRKERLAAELKGANSFELPTELANRRSHPEVREALDGEQALFTSRKRQISGQKQQLRKRISQLRDEIKGLDGQQKSKAKEVRLINEELGGLRKLARKKLVPVSRIKAMERETARIEGLSSQLFARRAQSNGRISEIEIQILQLDRENRTEVISEMRQVQTKIVELRERSVAARDQLMRVDIRAPQTGLVHQLSVHTVGGVINPSEPIMMIVPEGDDLVIEARIAQTDISNVTIGQNATVKFTAFNQRTTPEFEAKVSRVAADLTRDERNGVAYFVARMELLPDEADKLQDLRLLPGMPAEIFIKTSERTVMSYLLRPLFDQIARVFRKD